MITSSLCSKVRFKNDVILHIVHTPEKQHFEILLKSLIFKEAKIIFAPLFLLFLVSQLLYVYAHPEDL